MRHILLYVLMLLISFQYAFSQAKKPVQKPVYKQALKPVYNVKDDPSPVKFIRLKKDTPVYTPQSFYIQKVVDNTNSNYSIGFILQPQSGKKQRVSFSDGTIKGLEDFLNFKVARWPAAERGPSRPAISSYMTRRRSRRAPHRRNARAGQHRESCLDGLDRPVPVERW